MWGYLALFAAIGAAVGIYRYASRPRQAVVRPFVTEVLPEEFHRHSNCTCEMEPETPVAQWELDFDELIAELERTGRMI